MSVAATRGARLRSRDARTLVRGLAVAALAVAVSACGFHLRGSYSLPEALMPIHVDAPGGSDIGAALRESLKRQGAQLTDERDQAASSLAVLDESEERRVLSVDDAADVEEYEIRKTVRWQLVRTEAGENGDDGEGDGGDRGDTATGGGTRTLIAPNELQARRDYEFDSSQVLSKAEEERTLYRDMEESLAQQILFRLQAWSPEGD